MAKEELVVIKEAEITNNCPECFNQNMKISFFQKHKHTRLYHRITNEVTHKIVCNTCQSYIYPVKWTDDIERIFDYYQKMVEPEKGRIRFSGLFYGLIVFFIVLVAAVIYSVNTGLIEF